MIVDTLEIAALPEATTETPPADIPELAIREVQLHFIDVGQGDAILVRTPKGDVLVDTGGHTSADNLKAYLDEHNVRDLEYVIFTHPDLDHIAGGGEVLNHYHVKRVIRPRHDSSTKTYAALSDLIKNIKVEDIRADAESEFNIGEVKFTILAPLEENVSTNNDASVVLRVGYGNTSALLTGDAQMKAEHEMVSKYGSTKGGMLDCDLLKVAHHGSGTSSSEAFINAVRPEYAVISCGTNNKYGHPDEETIRRLKDARANVFRTDNDGSIVFVTNGTHLVVGHP